MYFVYHVLALIISLVLTSCGSGNCDTKSCGISTSGVRSEKMASFNNFEKKDMVETTIVGNLVTGSKIIVNNKSYENLNAYYDSLKSSMLDKLSAGGFDADSYTFSAENSSDLWRGMILNFSGTDSLSLTQTRSIVGDDATFAFLFNYVKNSVPDIQLSGFNQIPLSATSFSGESFNFCFKFSFMAYSRDLRGINVHHYIAEIEKSACMSRTSKDKEKEDLPPEETQEKYDEEPLASQ